MKREVKGEGRVWVGDGGGVRARLWACRRGRRREAEGGGRDVGRKKTRRKNNGLLRGTKRRTR